MSERVSDRLRGEPTQLGRFRINGRIGSGAMGVVYAAYDEVMGRQVALKVLIADLESDPDTRARFYREALAAARVIHPNVITIFDAGDDGGRSFIAMQLLQGAPLTHYLTSEDARGLERKIDLMIQVCEGLSAAHAEQVVHRDLKPSNLFVQTDGLLKILDFGVARLADSNMTAVGTMLGTPDYMSPEQARGTQVTASSDIFSAGSVFYFMLAGRKPFKGPDLRAVLRQLTTEDCDPLPPSVPPELANIVLRAMAKDPADRPARVEDLLSSLVRFRRLYVAETRRLVVSARSMHATVLDLVKDVDAVSLALGVEAPAAAPQALRALEGRFPALAARGAGLDMQPFERRVVDDVLAELSSHQNNLASIRDERRAQETRLESGHAALAEGNAVAALEHFDAVSRVLPSSPLVRDLVETTRPLAAEQEAREHRVALRVESARSAIGARDWSLAVRECQRALSLAPAHEEASSLLAEARVGQIEEQRRVAELLRQHLDRAMAALDAQEFTDAGASLDDADALQPGSPEVATLRRRLIEERAEAEAEAELHRLIAEEIRHARAAFRRGRADEALHQLRGFMEIEPRAEALSAELERLERLRETLAAGAAAARRAAADHLRRAAQLADGGAIDDAIAAARQGLAADPTDAAAAGVLDQLLVRAFDGRVKREEERLAQERAQCARPSLDAARRALGGGYIDFASRAAAAASRVAPASPDVRLVSEAAAEQMSAEDVEMAELGRTPYESRPAEAGVAPPKAAAVAIDSPRLDRALGMLKNVFMKSAPAAPRRQGQRR